MSVFKAFDSSDIQTARSSLNQLVDVINTDISGAQTRKKYQLFVTGGVGPGVTSSLFQTVFDQDFTLQTANAIFDMTVGLNTGSEVVSLTNPTIDSNGKYLFPQETLMMREKMDIYRQHAAALLGNSSDIFTARSGSTSHQIKEAMFINFKRLFSRDQMKRETFAIRLNPTASNENGNLNLIASSSTKIYTDVNSAVNKEFSFGGQVSTLVDSADTSQPVGLLYLDQGIAVLDMSRSFDQAQHLSGAIDAVNSSGIEPNFSGAMKYFLMSASIDDIVDHFASTRFSGSSTGTTAVTFQNITNINSTIYFCRAAADEFNYSSNPTYTDSNGRIVVIDEGQEETQQSFTYITAVGLYSPNNELLGVGKLSRGVIKDPSRDLTIRLRLDY